ncbi:MAG: DUF1255 family protein [Dethiobacter sp.]|nr:DUF1255 family protein [Dethiobacter sp.]
MIKVNKYFEGNVTSIGSESNGKKFTVGIILPGEYTFPTDSEEHVTITLGKCQVKLLGLDWVMLNQGETIIAPPKVDLIFKVEDAVSYICLYK